VRKSRQCGAREHTSSSDGGNPRERWVALSSKGLTGDVRVRGKHGGGPTNPKGLSGMVASVDSATQSSVIDEAKGGEVTLKVKTRRSTTRR